MRVHCLFLLSALLAPVAFAGPPSREQVEHQDRALQRLNTTLATAGTDADRFVAISRALADESDVETRRRIASVAAAIPGPEREAFLISRLTADEDAGLRSQAATELGGTGSVASLPALARAAASDRTSRLEIGCIVGESSARRAATFAIAKLAERIPTMAGDATAALPRSPPYSIRKIPRASPMPVARPSTRSRATPR